MINYLSKKDLEPMDKLCVRVGTDYEEQIPCVPHVSESALISAIAIIAKLHERVKELEEKIKDD